MTRFDPSGDPERIIRDLEHQMKMYPLRTVRLTGLRDKLLGLFLISRHFPLSETALQQAAAEISTRLEQAAALSDGPVSADHPCLAGSVPDSRIEEILACEIERAQFTRLPCALIMLQIEGAAGLQPAEARQQFLAEVTFLVRAILRRSDIILPCDGARFAVILPGISRREATDCAERIRQELSRKIPAGGKPGREMAASIGIGYCQAPTRISAGAFTARVVRELERAREQGGDRICQAVLTADSPCQVSLEERTELFRIFAGDR